MGPHQDLERGGGHDCAGVAGEGAVGGGEDVAGRDDGASAERDILSGENHGDLGETWTHFIYVFIEIMYYSNGPTCHGNWLTSVSTPPTILVALLAMPQLQGVETEPDEGVVVVPVTGFVGEGVV